MEGGLQKMYCINDEQEVRGGGGGGGRGPAGIHEKIK
jgi:hypothetical protein